MRQAANFDATGEAASSDRFTFIVRFVARMTQRKADRALTNGMYVRETRAGWEYGFDGLPAASCRPVSPNALYDMIRRTALNHYVQMAEDFRAQALAG